MQIVRSPLGFQGIYSDLKRMIVSELDSHEVSVGEWQSLKIAEGSPMGLTREIEDVCLTVPIPQGVDDLQRLVEPNLPWAEDHFQERVSGEPLNPPPSSSWWPFAQKDNVEHKANEVFSHTYPERFWPKMANVGGETDKGRQIFVPHVGIRFEYGDLWDVVQMLKASPFTRQAFLPVWFPEDTGAVHGERVPCTLGYHFLIRRGRLKIVYYIRSCDLLRHFKDDVYMACRLNQWVVDQLGILELKPGNLVMHISSLHVFDGDIPGLGGVQ